MSLHLRIARRVALLRKPRRPFAIISNNCWGAHVYRALRTPYSTPFIGLFVAPQCYTRLVADFEALRYQPLKFTATTRYRWIEDLRAERNWTYPIGLLGKECELHFLHYGSAGEALEKWQRRTARSVDAELFFKFCDRDGCSEEDLKSFDSSPWRNKVVFTSRRHDSIKSSVWIREVEPGDLPDGMRLSEISFRYFDAISWVRGGNPRHALRQLIACA